MTKVEIGRLILSSAQAFLATAFVMLIGAPWRWILGALWGHAAGHMFWFAATGGPHTVFGYGVPGLALSGAILATAYWLFLQRDELMQARVGWVRRLRP